MIEEILNLNVIETRLVITPDETDARFLQVVELPLFMRETFHEVNRIFVRDCYTELYNLSTENLLISPSCKFLFKGVPGIGKTTLILYFLYRFLQDVRFPTKCFAFEFKANEVVILRITEEGQLVMSEFPQQRSSLLSRFIPNTMLFVDYMEEVEPKLYGERGTLIFSSPDPKRFKYTMKKSPRVKICVPTWTVQEIRLLDPPNNNWLELFEVYGGVPRYVVVTETIDPYEELENAVITKNIDLIRNYFQHGFGGTDQMMNYVLLHINPPVVNGVYQYTSFPVMTIASNHIFKRLSQMHERHVLFEAARTLNLGAAVAKKQCGVATSGHIFEKLCLWLIPFDGKVLKLQTLPPLHLFFGNAESLRVPLEAELLSSEWADNEQLRPNILYKPRTSRQWEIPTRSKRMDYQE